MSNDAANPEERDEVAPPDGLLRIGQLASQCGKTVRALHLYEELGLLKPVIRSKGGFRLYSQSAVDRVQWINRLQEADVSLTEIKEFLQNFEGEAFATAAMAKVRALLEKKLGEVRLQRARLAQLEADLQAGLEYLAGCKVCEPEHLKTECGTCRLHGHDGIEQPLIVAGIHAGVNAQRLRGEHGD